MLYDAEQFEFLTVSAQEMIEEEICSTNTKTQGHIGLDFISLSGVNGSGNIWRVALRAKSTATAAKHNLMLAVGEAYNTALSPISVYSENASVEVNGAYQGYNTIEFYSGYSNYSVTAGEQVTLWMYSGNLLGLAAADFELEYNHKLLRLDEVMFGNVMTEGQNAIYSINDKNPGYVKANYISQHGIDGYVDQVISFTFTVNL